MSRQEDAYEQELHEAEQEIARILKQLQENNEESYRRAKEDEAEITRLKGILREIADFDTAVFCTDVDVLYEDIYKMKAKAESGL